MFGRLHLQLYLKSDISFDDAYNILYFFFFFVKKIPKQIEK
jgi:hypothetical protein